MWFIPIKLFSLTHPCAKIKKTVGDDSMNSEKGLIFNIQKYSIHDGPGIRTLVFFKGCPLACKWCSNPEGIVGYEELSYKKSKCITIDQCGFCLKSCPINAIQRDESGIAKIDRHSCSNCMHCVTVCPSKAIEQIGHWMTVEEIIAEVTSDSAFYSRSGGGMTLSGGEPLLQADFVVKLLQAAHEEGLKTAIETTGCVPWDQAKLVFSELDFIHMDIKSLDSDKHKAYTGRDNTLILENFTKLCQTFPNKPIIARTPVIPGFNDTLEDLQAIADFINKVGKHHLHLQYELLPFHNFGSSKYEFQDKPYAFADYKNMNKGFVQTLREKIQKNSSIPLVKVR